MSDFTRLRRERDTWRDQYIQARVEWRTYAAAFNLTVSNKVQWFFRSSTPDGSRHEFGFATANNLAPVTPDELITGSVCSELLLWRTCLPDGNSHASAWSGSDALNKLARQYTEDDQPRGDIVQLLNDAERELRKTVLR